MPDATVNDVEHFAALAVGQTRIEEWFQPVQRKMQRMQDQVGGLIVGIVAAVPEKQAGLIEAAHREAQIIAHGAQILRRLGKITAHVPNRISSVR